MKHIRVGPFEIAMAVVVIGVGAILYPLLVPVRQVPHRSSPLGNLKQIGTTIFIYHSNYDDTYPPLATVGPSPKPWTNLLHPYIKNRQIFGDYAHPDDKLDPMIFGGIGLNYAALSTTTNRRLRPLTMSAVEHPERTITHGTLESTTQIVNHAPTGIPYVMSLEPPVCPPNNEVCIGGWGTNFWVKRAGMSPANSAASRGRLGDPYRREPEHKGPHFAVCFADGHGVSRTLPELAAGTDCQVRDDWVLAPCRVTDPTTYLWGRP